MTKKAELSEIQTVLIQSIVRDHSFFMGKGGRWFLGVHLKIFKLKGRP